MAAKSNPLDEVLHQYDKFLHDKGLAQEKHRPYLVRHFKGEEKGTFCFIDDISRFC
jgi:hypothetical protein